MKMDKKVVELIYEQRQLIENIVLCHRHLDEVSEQFTNNNDAPDDFEIITKKGKKWSTVSRSLYVCPKLKKRLAAQGLTIKAWMKHLGRPALHRMVQHFLTTLPAYDKDAEYPSGQLINFLTWTEFNTTYGYLIYQNDSFTWQIPTDLNETFVRFSKENNRHFECRQTHDGEVVIGFLNFVPTVQQDLPLTGCTSDLDFQTFEDRLSLCSKKSQVQQVIENQLHMHGLDACHTVPDLQYTSARDKQLNVMCKKHI